MKTSTNSDWLTGIGLLALASTSGDRRADQRRAPADDGLRHQHEQRSRPAPTRYRHQHHALVHRRGRKALIQRLPREGPDKLLSLLQKQPDCGVIRVPGSI